MKKVLVVIVCLLIGFLGYGVGRAVKLQNLQIVKSVTVKGSPKEVFDMVRYLGNFPKWSPFLAEDPSQKYEVKGTDGEVGASYHWVGNGGEDVGYQTIMQIDTLNFVGMKCDIQKPFVAKPSFEYSFKETPDGVVVTQDFKLESGLVEAFFMWAFGAVKDMENTNQQGLDLLKKAVEK
ncbi:MAG: SRPBCC family protein [Emticicia sp.]|nr:SRPBCC family protein [Emticicia sp.]